MPFRVWGAREIQHVVVESSSQAQGWEGAFVDVDRQGWEGVCVDVDGQ